VPLNVLVQKVVLNQIRIKNNVLDNFVLSFKALFYCGETSASSNVKDYFADNAKVIKRNMELNIAVVKPLFLRGYENLRQFFHRPNFHKEFFI